MDPHAANPAPTSAAAVTADPAYAEPAADPAAAMPAPPIANAPPRRTSDAVGIGLTVACAIHCLATPLLALLPLGSIFASHAAEWILPAAAVALALPVLMGDYRKVHDQRAPLALLGVAAALLTAGHALDDVATLGTAIALAGSACMATAILINLRLRRRHRACPTHASPSGPLAP